MLLSVLTFGGMSLGWSILQPVEYRAEALVEVVHDEAALDADTAAEANVIENPTTVALVDNQLNLTESIQTIRTRLRVEPIPNTAVLRLIYEDTDQAVAAQAANAFARTYLDTRRDTLEENLEAERAKVESRLTEVNRELGLVATDLEGAQAAENEKAAANLQQRKTELQALITNLRLRLDELARAEEGISGGELLEEAAMPLPPASPRHIRAVLGAAFGLMVGFLLALLTRRARHADSNIKRAAGAIPRWRRGRRLPAERRADDEPKGSPRYDSSS